VLYKLGRLLQVVGLLLLPVAMAGNLVPDAPINLRNMLALMALGVVIFFVGWKMQEMGKGK
jgi:predicted acyltransferase